jgi:hypothetical protein
MSYFAQINENNQVTQIIVADQDFINNISGTWIESCSITVNGDQVDLGPALHKRYANIGDTYDLSRDAFIPPKPFNSWILDESTYSWQSPVVVPDDSKEYTWDESAQSWL